MMVAIKEKWVVLNMLLVVSTTMIMSQSNLCLTTQSCKLIHCQNIAKQYFHSHYSGPDLVI